MERAIKSSEKRHKDFSDVERIDRLSGLPEEVILHILSFLPTNLSVGTSVLARRWRFLWAHVPNLDFDYVNFTRGATSLSSFANRVMSLHKAQCLNTFRIIHVSGPGLMDGSSAYDFETCIATAIARNVRSLYLCLNVELPRCFMTCKSLVDLGMYGRVFIPLGGQIFLPSLKRLNFFCTELHGSLTHLLSGCPVLEELIVQGDPYDSSGCCNINSPSLERLTFDFSSDCLVHRNDYRVKIDAPALKYLKVWEFLCYHISISPTTSLIEADIWLDNGSNEISYTSCALKLLDSLCNVKCLNLSRGYKFPDVGLARSRVRFDKLTKLEMDFCTDWRLLTKFLENADHLEVLVMRKVPYIPQQWMENIEERCACLLHSLRTVTIHGFYCTEQHEFNMVRYILKNAQVLKRMQIYSEWYDIDLKAKFDALQKISLFHGGSKECELAFS